MKIEINGETAELAQPSTVGTVVDMLGRGRRGIAAARNEELVPRSLWDNVDICDGDRIEILVAAQGG